MNRRHYFLIIIGFIMSTSIGCSSSCGPRMTFKEWFQNRPRPIRDLFTRGDECSDCAVPAGQVDLGGFDCPNGNCLSGPMPADPGYYPSNLPPAAASSGGENRLRAGYPPASSEIGSGVRSFNSNAELDLPPMYGRSN